MPGAYPRLWLHPVAVATALLITLPLGADDGSFSDNALIVLEVIFATVNATMVLTAILLPGAAAHTWLMRRLEERRIPVVVRAPVGLALSPLIGAWVLIFTYSDVNLGSWLFFGCAALFACASVWYGSRRRNRRDPTARTAPATRLDRSADEVASGRSGRPKSAV